MSDWELRLAAIRAEADEARREAVMLSGDPELSEIAVCTRVLLWLLDLADAATWDNGPPARRGDFGTRAAPLAIARH
jgi:hypothetical protein